MSSATKLGTDSILNNLEDASTTTQSITASLSCTRCKSRKLRCSRDRPVCVRCKNADVECIYLSRKSKPKNVVSRAAVIAGILSRLDEIEKRLGITTSLPSMKRSTPEQLDSAAEENVAEDDSESDESEDGNSLMALEHLVTRATTDTLDAIKGRAAVGFPTDGISTISPLSEALSQIRRVKLNPAKRNEEAGNSELPRALASKWLKAVYSHSWYEHFFDLVDRRLIYAMPDIINAPEVKVDYSLMIIYYNALYYGWSDDPHSMTPELKHYGTGFYLQCLRLLPAWKSDGKIEVADVVGLILFTWMAIENFDYQLAYKLHTATCEVTQTLGLHELDTHPDIAPFLNTLPSTKRTAEQQNHLRHVFWRIMHVEYFFRLYYDKPANISKFAFRVNFPQIDATTGDDANTDAIIFLINSRLTLMTKDFFEFADQLDVEEDALDEYVKELQHKIVGLLTEWNVYEWVQKPHLEAIDTWLYCDVFITGHLIIILTERKVASRFDRKLHPSPQAVSAARSILQMISLRMTSARERLPYSHSFISLYPFITFFTLFQHLVHQLCTAQHMGSSTSSIDEDSLFGFDTATIEKDITLMENLTSGFQVMSSARVEMKPVVHALNALNSTLRSMLDHQNVVSNPDSSRSLHLLLSRNGSLVETNTKSRSRMRQAEDDRSNKRQRTSSFDKGQNPSPGNEQGNEGQAEGSRFTYHPTQMSAASMTKWTNRVGSNHNNVQWTKPAAEHDTATILAPIDMGQVSNRQLEPQLLHYVDMLENDLFGRNWHEDWWT